MSPTSSLTGAGRDFEEKLQQLQDAVTALEGGQLNLEESLNRYQQACQLAAECQQYLTAVENQLQDISKMTSCPSKEENAN